MQESRGDKSMVNAESVSFGEVMFSIIKWFILIFSALIVIIPAIHILAASFSSPEALVEGVYLWPTKLSLEGYETAFKNPAIMVAYKNTLIYVVVGAVLNTTLTILAAYPLSRKNMPGRNWIMFLFAFTMLFNGGLIPTFMVVNKLGLVDKIWALVLVDGISVWIMIVMRTYFQSNIPVEMYEAASIDGCSDFKMLRRIVLPSSKASIALALLLYAVGIWNGYFNAIVYLRSDDMLPLQLVLRNLLLSTKQLSAETIRTMPADNYARLQQLQYVLKYSCIVISTVPMLCIYPFVQKHFVKGIMIGSIKG